jgi:hypothetical protein
MLALKGLSVYHFTVRPLNYLDSAVSAAVQKERLHNSSLFAWVLRLGVPAVVVSVENLPV